MVEEVEVVVMVVAVMGTEVMAVVVEVAMEEVVMEEVAIDMVAPVQIMVVEALAEVVDTKVEWSNFLFELKINKFPVTLAAGNRSRYSVFKWLIS